MRFVLISSISFIDLGTCREKISQSETVAGFLNHNSVPDLQLHSNRKPR